MVKPYGVCDQYGADSLRLYELFMGPLEEGVLWETSGVAGVRRFLDRTWRLAFEDESDRPSGKLNGEAGAEAAGALARALHAAIKMVSEAVVTLKFNTAISAMMVFVNTATRAQAVPRQWFLDFVKILSPFAPHVCEELWQRLDQPESISMAPWPEYDAAVLADATVTIAVQVDGKLRGTLQVPAGATRLDVLSRAGQIDNVVRQVAGRSLRKQIFVPDRLVNLVTE